MSEALLEGPPMERILEVGTGCGYQTAVLAPLVDRIYSIERIEGLQTRARARLKELGVRNVRFKVGDGSVGWRSQAPFDGIIVAAAPLVVPEELIAQLALNGRLIVPAGPEGKQQLLRIVRREQGVERQVLGAVSFVPLVGGVG